MVAAIGVEIEHRRFVRLLDLEGPSTGALSLSTLADRQPRAVVRVLVRFNGTTEVVQEISVRGIPPMPAGKPRIDLSGRFDGRRTLSLSVQLEGRPHATATIDVGRFTARRRTGWIVAAAVLAVAALGAAAWWWLAPRGTGQAPALASAAEETSRPPRPADKPAEPEAEAPPEVRDADENRVGDAAAAENQPQAPEPAADRPETDAGTGEPPTRAESVASRGDGTDSAAETDPATESESVPAQAPDEQERREPHQASEDAAAEEATAGAAAAASAAAVAEQPDTPPEEAATDGPAAPVWPSVQARRLSEGKVARVYFPPDSAELTAPAKAELDAILQVLSGNAGKRVAIVGHCALFGTEQGRIELSSARAREVGRYLREAGWRPVTQPTTQGLGAQEPLTREPEEQARNRRVELRFVDSAE